MTSTDPAPIRNRAGARATTVRRRHQQVHDLLTIGKNLNEIARELGLARATVRRFAQGTVEQLLPERRRIVRAGVLEPFAEHLSQQFAAGVTNATALFEEIRTLGYRGGYGAVRDFIRPLRLGHPAPKLRPSAPSTRDMTGLILSDPATLDHDETAQLKHIRTCCPDLDRIAGHVTM